MKNKISFLASAFFVFAILLVAPVLAKTGDGSTIATSEGEIKAGITPDSPFYFLDTAFDNMGLALTSNSWDRAEKGLNIARERLLEAQVMIEKKNLEAASEAEVEHHKSLEGVSSSLSSFRMDDSKSQMQREFEFERKVAEHEAEIERMHSEIEIEVEVEGTLTSEQQARLDAFIASLREDAFEVKQEIKSKREFTQIRFELESGLSENIEVKVGITNSKVEIHENGIEKEFVLQTTDQAAIMNGIAAKLGTSVDSLQGKVDFRSENRNFESEDESHQTRTQTQTRTRTRDRSATDESDSIGDVSGNSDETEIRGNADENEIRGGAGEAEIRGNADENEIRGNADENELRGGLGETEVHSSAASASSSSSVDISGNSDEAEIRGGGSSGGSSGSGSGKSG